jgi:hypothetical protein
VNAAVGAYAPGFWRTSLYDSEYDVVLPLLLFVAFPPDTLFVELTEEFEVPPDAVSVGASVFTFEFELLLLPELFTLELLLLIDPLEETFWFDVFCVEFCEFVCDWFWDEFWFCVWDWF